MKYYIIDRIGEIAFISVYLHIFFNYIGLTSYFEYLEIFNINILNILMSFLILYLSIKNYNSIILDYLRPYYFMLKQLIIVLLFIFIIFIFI
jgi:hypothetical protein